MAWRRPEGERGLPLPFRPSGGWEDAQPTGRDNLFPQPTPSSALLSGTSCLGVP